MEALVVLMAAQPDAQIVADADTLADMARRIGGNAHDTFYCREKAWIAAKAATRILARTHVARERDPDVDVESAEDAFRSFVETFQREWEDNVRWARNEHAEAG
ncbi:MAG TPA: hypothetical protein VF024_12205 [Solirubrobacteraceae bacterium]